MYLSGRLTTLAHHTRVAVPAIFFVCPMRNGDRQRVAWHPAPMVHLALQVKPVLISGQSERLEIKSEYCIAWFEKAHHFGGWVP